MGSEGSGARRGASRSAALVAACRMLERPTEALRPRYGLEPLPRHYPTRMITATRCAY